MSDNKTIRWGILGCGDVARRRVVGAIAEDPGSELLAVCRRNAAALEQFCIGRTQRIEGNALPVRQ